MQQFKSMQEADLLQILTAGDCNCQSTHAKKTLHCLSGKRPKVSWQSTGIGSANHEFGKFPRGNLRRH